MKYLDFIIIGAQKSATTSLFKYLNPHPQVFMPPGKEAPFFCIDDLYLAGWKGFSDEFFRGAPGNKLWGKATPQYMGDRRIPQRIYRLMPSVKLIAILRNPVERAFSHYKMCIHRNVENRTFNGAVLDLLDNESLIRSREQPVEVGNASSETRLYIVWGEYGRILKDYSRYFPEDQLLILFTENLKKNPVTEFKKIIKYLGIDTEFLPKNINKQYHRGGNRKRFPILSRYIFRMLPLLPERYAKSIRYWIEQALVYDDKTLSGPDDKIRAILVAHYRDDVKIVSELSKESPPWPEFN